MIALRLRLLGWAFVLVLLAIVGVLLLALISLTGTFANLWVGVPATVFALALQRSFANWHRDWTQRMLGVEIPRPYRAVPVGGSLVRLWAALRDPATYRDLLWLVANATVGATLLAIPLSLVCAFLWQLTLPLLWQLTPPGLFISDLGVVRIDSLRTSLTIGYPLGLLSLVLAVWIAGPVMRLYGALTHSLLAPTEAARLAARVRDLADSRAETVDAQAAELRRIERDLHDGAQARLVGVGMKLGLAEELLTRDPAAVAKLIVDARESAVVALAELRDLVRGIHPPVLADRGLVGGVRALALACPRPVTVDIELGGAVPAPVESAAYFAVAELLANAVKHSAAAHLSVHLRHREGRLVIAVEDNGNGGATVVAGGGLYGIERRLAAFDGILTVVSPRGGPTIAKMEIPCALS